ncbi:MAG: DUF2218 domain-containing protein [Sulfitobacter sp.]
MPTTTGYYQTTNASKYLQQLCKHFGHKIEVSYDAKNGWAAFEMGTAHLSANDDGLTITCTVQTPAAVSAVHGVIDSHLEKFAFREAFKTMDWVTQ